MDNIEPLTTELETYERQKQQLVAESEGKYVLIYGSEVAGVWDTYHDALKAGFEKFQLKPFLVKQIEGVDRVHHFTRDIELCQS